MATMKAHFDHSVAMHTAPNYPGMVWNPSHRTDVPSLSPPPRDITLSREDVAGTTPTSKKAARQQKKESRRTARATRKTLGKAPKPKAPLIP